jgi:hypothetical protein
VTADDGPRPEPADGTSVISMASRTSSCLRSSPRETIFFGVVDVDAGIEGLLDDDVNVLVDGAVQDAAAMLDEVPGPVGPAADESDAQRVWVMIIVASVRASCRA